MSQKKWAIYAVNPSTNEMHALLIITNADWPDDALKLAAENEVCKPYFGNPVFTVFAINMSVGSGSEDIYVQLSRCLDRAQITRAAQIPFIDAFRKQWLAILKRK